MSILDYISYYILKISERLRQLLLGTLGESDAALFVWLILFSDFKLILHLQIKLCKPADIFVCFPLKISPLSIEFCQSH